MPNPERCPACTLRLFADSDGRCVYCVSIALTAGKMPDHPDYPKVRWEPSLPIPVLTWDKGLDLTTPKKTFRDYIRIAKAKTIEGWALTVLASFAFLEAAGAFIEFVLHVLRIPHWH